MPDKKKKPRVQSKDIENFSVSPSASTAPKIPAGTWHPPMPFFRTPSPQPQAAPNPRAFEPSIPKPMTSYGTPAPSSSPNADDEFYPEADGLPKPTPLRPMAGMPPDEMDEDGNYGTGEPMPGNTPTYGDHFSQPFPSGEMPESEPQADQQTAEPLSEKPPLQYADENDSDLLRKYLRERMSPEYEANKSAQDKRNEDDLNRSNIYGFASRAASKFGTLGGVEAGSLLDGKDDDQELALRMQNQGNADNRRKELYADLYKKAGLDAAAKKQQQTYELGMAKLAKEKSVDTEKRDYDRAKDIRDQTIKSDPVKQSRIIETAYRDMLSAANDPSPAGDQAMVFNYMKVLDPTSTVREGEQAQVKDSRGVPDSIRNFYNQVMRGLPLTDNQRRDLVTTAGRRRQVIQTEANNFMASQEAMGSKYGLDPDIYAMRPDYGPEPVLKSPKGSLKKPGSAPTIPPPKLNEMTPEERQRYLEWKRKREGAN